MRNFKFSIKTIDDDSDYALNQFESFEKLVNEVIDDGNYHAEDASFSYAYGDILGVHTDYDLIFEPDTIEVEIELNEGTSDKLCEEIIDILNSNITRKDFTPIYNFTADKSRKNIFYLNISFKDGTIPEPEFT